MVDQRDDPHRGGIVSPCSFSPSFVAHRRHTWRSNRFGVEAAERDGSNPDDDAPPHLTGYYHQSPVQILLIPT
jgi:hypothetical protein